MIKAVLFDVDGTLVDSNDAHAEAWVKAFSEFNIAVDPDKVRRCIGMGSDKLMPTMIGIMEHSPFGSRIAGQRATGSQIRPPPRRTRGPNRCRPTPTPRP